VLPHPGGVFCVATVPDGRDRVVSGCEDGCARLWTPDGVLSKTFVSGRQSAVYCICVIDGCVVTGSADKVLRVFDLETGYYVRVLGQHDNPVRGMRPWFAMGQHLLPLLPLEMICLCECGRGRPMKWPHIFLSNLPCWQPWPS